jgi:hypothetical protein
MKDGRSDRHATPAVFWHSYDHPERRPDPDGATALGATVAAFPSWYFHLVCGACGHSAHVSQGFFRALLLGASPALVVQHVADVADRGVHLADVFALFVAGHAAVHQLAGLAHVLEVLPQ